MKRHAFAPSMDSLEDKVLLGASPAMEIRDASFSAIVGAMKPKPKPAPPSFLATVLSSTRVALTWFPVKNATGYLVEVQVNGNWVQLAKLSKKAPGYVVTNLTPGATYTFNVVWLKGKVKHWEAPKSVTIPDPTPVITGIQHPKSPCGYEVAPGILWDPSTGPVYQDAAQGGLSDCWLIAALAEVAARRKGTIIGMFTPKGTFLEDGVKVDIYAVRFHMNGSTVEVLVDNELPCGGAPMTAQ